MYDPVAHAPGTPDPSLVPAPPPVPDVAGADLPSGTWPRDDRLAAEMAAARPATIDDLAAALDGPPSLRSLPAPEGVDRPLEDPHVTVIEGPPAPTEDTRPRKRIAIVGYTPSRNEAPFDDPAWEVWGMNNLHLFIPPEKFDRWYNLHTPVEIQADAQHVQWLASWRRTDVYLMDPMEGQVAPDGSPLPSLPERTGVPRAVAFPASEIRAMFGDYFTNTVSWQIAHAIYEAVTHDDYVLAEIALFGVDMAVNTEYAAQRPSVEYYLGLARGLGVEITLPETSDLLKSIGLYGMLDQTSGFIEKLRRRRVDLTQQRAQVEANVDMLRAQYHHMSGALEILTYIIGAWGQPSASRDAEATPEGGPSMLGGMLAAADLAERHRSDGGQPSVVAPSAGQG